MSASSLTGTGTTTHDEGDTISLLLPGGRYPHSALGDADAAPNERVGGPTGIGSDPSAAAWSSAIWGGLVIRRIGIVGLAASFSQLLQFLAQPLLASHALAPDFGALAKLTTLAAFLSIVASLQLHIAYLSENDERGQRAIRQVTNLVSIGMALLAFTIGVGSGWRVSDSTSPLLGSLLLGLLVWSYSTGNFQISVLVKAGAFRSVAAFTALRAVLVVVIQYMLVRNAIPGGLLLGLVAGEMMSRILVMLLPEVRILAAGVKEPAMMASVLARYRHFTVSGTVQEAISSFNFLMPLFVVPAYYGSFVGGLFAVVHRLTWAPVQLANQAAGAVVTDHLSRCAPDALRAFFFRYLIVLAPAWAASLVGLWLATYMAVTHLFSPEWLVARDMVGWIALWAASFFAALPARYVVRVKRWQSTQLGVEIAMALAVTVAVLAVSTATDFVRIACSAGAIQNFLLVALVAWRLRARVRKTESGGVSE